MHIDVDVSFARQCEHAINLTVVVGIVTGRRADAGRPFIECFEQKSVSFVGLCQTFLRESANFHIDRPSIFFCCLHHALEADEAGGRIDFDMGPHPGGAVGYAFLKRSTRPLVNVFDREFFFGFSDPGRVIGWSGLRFGGTTIKDTCFVEMNVGLDQARCGEFAIEIDDLFGAGQAGSDFGDSPVNHPQIEQSVGFLSENIRVLKDSGHCDSRFPIFDVGIV